MALEWTVEKYVSYKTLLYPTIAELNVLQQYIHHAKKLEYIKNNHCTALKNTRNTTYNEGDVVALKSQPLNSTSYRLKAKFMPHYNEEYTVVG